MYQIENSGVVIKQKDQIFSSLKKFSGTPVFILGLTSMFTDISSEMISTTLPIYLIFTLHFSPLQFGFIDGLYQGASVLIRLISGLVSDKLGKPKQIATLGYLFSAINKIGFVIATPTWGALTSLVFLDRIGKGIRTPSRDAMIAHYSSDKNLAASFGIHRAMDTFGAMFGPLLAAILLGLYPNAFRVVFAASMGFALIGVLVIALFAPSDENIKSDKSKSLSKMDFKKLINLPQFKNFMFANAMLSLVTISDSFLYLALQKQFSMPPQWFPLLFVAVALVFMLTAVPIGKLADKYGKKKVFSVGYILLALSYLLIVSPIRALPIMLFVLLLFGLYYACTDGVLAAAISQIVPSNMKATGLAMISTTGGLMKIFSSIALGWLWEKIGMEQAISIFVLGLFLTLAFFIYFFNRYSKLKIS